MDTWKAFWFEGNQFFDWVRSPEDWERVKKAYSQDGCEMTTDELLDKSREAPGADVPKYGLRIECDGEKTLREFFAENGMGA